MLIIEWSRELIHQTELQGFTTKSPIKLPNLLQTIKINTPIYFVREVAVGVSILWNNAQSLHNSEFIDHHS